MGTAKYTVEIPATVARDLKQLSLDTGKSIKQLLTLAVTEYLKYSQSTEYLRHTNKKGKEK